MTRPRSPSTTSPRWKAAAILLAATCFVATCPVALSLAAPARPASPAQATQARARADEELPLPRSEVPLELERCREVRRFDATTYWFWDAYFGTEDEVERGPERQGRLVLDEAICFRVSVEVLDDPVARTTGYREAVDQLVQWVDDSPEADDDDDSEAGRAREALRELTGLRMSGGETWASWWQDNRDYAWTAERPGRLEIVEAAKAAGAPIDEHALVLDAEEYWFYEGRGWISRLESRGEYLLGEVRIPPHGYGFRAHTAEIDDRGAKENGYRLALENLMVDGLMSPDLSRSTARDLMARARALTGQDFDSPEAWVGWWEDHKGRLALASDGDRLVSR